MLKGNKILKGKQLGLIKTFMGLIFGLSKGTEKISVPDNSAGDLFKG